MSAFRPSFVLLLLALFACLFSPVSSIGDEHDFGGASDTWATFASVVAPGFCLPYSPSTAGSRTVANFSRPLYNVRIRFGIPYISPVDAVAVWISKILIQEVIGYKVAIVDPVTLNYNWPFQLLPSASAPPPVDLLPSSGYLDAKPVEMNAVITNFVSTNQFASLGQYQVPEEGGFYVSNKAIEGNPDRSLLHWRSYSGGIALNSRTAHLAFPYTESHMAEVRKNVEVFRNATWSAVLNNPTGILNDPTDPSKGVACPPDYVLDAINAGFRANCNDPNFPSLYIPPQCYPDPVAQCAVIFTYSVFLTGTFTSAAVRNLNLSFVVAYMGVTGFNTPEVLTGMKNYVVIGASQTDVALNTCNSPSLGGPVNCYRRMEMPSYNNLCMVRFSGSADGEYYCAAPIMRKFKFGRADLSAVAPRVDYLMRRMDYNLDDVQEMFTLIRSNAGDTKTAACKWLQKRVNDTMSWRSWIAPPEQCKMSDYSFNLSPCDSTTNNMRVSYYWVSRSCKGGVTLPPDEFVSCSFYTTESTHYSASFSMAAVISVIPAIYLSIFAVQLAFGVSASNAVLATRAIALSKRLQAANPEQSKPAVYSASGPGSAMALTRLPSICQFFLCLPVSQCFGPFLSVFEIGQVLLLIILWVNIGELTNGRCWTRSSLLYVGLSMMNFALAAAVYKLRLAFQRLIGQKQERKLLIAFFFVLTAIVLIFIIGSQSESSMYHTALLNLRTGAAVPYSYCASLPSWLAYTLIVLNVFPALYSLLVSIYLWFTVQLDSAIAALGGSSRMRSSKHFTRTRSQIIQVNTLLMSTLVFLASAGVLMTYAEDNASKVNNNLDTVYSMGVYLLVFVAVLNLLLFGPSFLYHYQQSKRLNQRVTSSALPPIFAKIKEKAKSKASAPDSQQVHPAGSRVSAVKSNQTTGALASGLDSGTGALLDVPVDGSEFQFGGAAASPKESSHSESAWNDVSDQEGTEELLSLSNVLSDPMASYLFERFAESAFDAEGVHFLFHCKQLFLLLKQQNLTLAQLRSGLESLISEFVTTDAPQQINISGQLRNDLTVGWQRYRTSLDNYLLAQCRGSQDANAFKAAGNLVTPSELRTAARSLLVPVIREVYNLLQVNTYVRFLSSKEAMRANELIVWSETLLDMSSGEQDAMVKRLNQLIKRSRGRDDQSQLTVGQSSGSGSKDNDEHLKERMILEQPQMPLQNELMPGAVPTRSPLSEQASLGIPSPANQMDEGSTNQPRPISPETPVLGPQSDVPDHVSIGVPGFIPGTSSFTRQN